jgi:hypothetical protein
VLLLLEGELEEDELLSLEEDFSPEVPCSGSNKPKVSVLFCGSSMGVSSEALLSSVASAWLSQSI